MSGLSTADGSIGLGSQARYEPIVRISPESDELGWAEEMAIESLRTTAIQVPDGAMWEPRAQ
jgi:hypothetical protein